MLLHSLDWLAAHPSVAVAPVLTLLAADAIRWLAWIPADFALGLADGVRLELADLGWRGPEDIRP